MYGDSGYLYHFSDGTFVYKEGLGELEVVTNEPTKPIHVERINDPIAEMRELGVKFVFVDIARPENERYRLD